MLDYDAWIPNLNIWNFLARGEADITNPLVQQAFIQRICPGIQQMCVGPNQQYAEYVSRHSLQHIWLIGDSVDACIASMNSKPFGNYDEVWGDNVACRTIHLILAGVRPDVRSSPLPFTLSLIVPIVFHLRHLMLTQKQAHCPHVGPTGGMKCVNEPYNDGYFDDADLFGHPQGKTFICPDKKEEHRLELL